LPSHIKGVEGDFGLELILLLHLIYLGSWNVEEERLTIKD